jgi:hypothetical protein
MECLRPVSAEMPAEPLTYMLQSPGAARDRAPFYSLPQACGHSNVKFDPKGRSTGTASKLTRLKPGHRPQQYKQARHSQGLLV